MRRGMRKFNVTAAQSVSRKNPNLRATNLISRASCSGDDRSAPLPLRLQVEEYDTPVGSLVCRRPRVGLALGNPAADVLGVVLVPVDTKNISGWVTQGKPYRSEE